MQLEHEFTVPVPVEDAWQILLDVERVAPCMPGAALESIEGDSFTGKVTVKVGPITVTYRGRASFAEKDEAGRRIVMEANGREARGSGTAQATVRSQLYEQDSSTRVVVQTELNITGRPAQFGRGVMAEVGNKIIGRFAACLADQLSQPVGEPEPADPAAVASAAATSERPAEDGAADGGEPAAPAAELGSATTEGSPEGSAADAPRLRPVQPAREWGPAGAVGRPEAEPIDLLDTAGWPVLKRLAPIVGTLLVLGFLWRRLRKR